MTVYNIKTCQLDDLMIDIFNQLKTMEEATTKHRKYWFNGEGDSNQTTYEYLSNNLKICVLAKNKKVAMVLHTFLRIIIDKNRNDWWASWLEGGDEFTMDEIVKALGNINTDFGMKYNPKKDGLYAETKLGYGENQRIVSAYVGDIDCWDIWRIGCEVGAFDRKDQYPEHK